MVHAIEITNLSKNYGRIQALKDVSLSIDEGEVFGLSIQCSITIYSFIFIKCRHFVCFIIRSVDRKSVV